MKGQRDATLGLSKFCLCIDLPNRPQASVCPKVTYSVWAVNCWSMCVHALAVTHLHVIDNHLEESRQRGTIPVQGVYHLHAASSPSLNHYFKISKTIFRSCHPINILGSFRVPYIPCTHKAISFYHQVMKISFNATPHTSKRYSSFQRYSATDGPL